MNKDELVTALNPPIGYIPYNMDVSSEVFHLPIL
jgi:hypothetical protein